MKNNGVLYKDPKLMTLLRMAKKAKKKGQRFVRRYGMPDGGSQQQAIKDRRRREFLLYDNDRGINLNRRRENKYGEFFFDYSYRPSKRKRSI